MNNQHTRRHPPANTVRSSAAPPPRRPAAPRRVGRPPVRGDSQWVRVIPRQQAMAPPRQIHTPQMKSAVAPNIMPPALPRRANPASRPQTTGMSRRSWAMIVGISFVVITVFGCIALMLGTALVYSNGILPGVSVAGVNVGGMSEEEAAQKIASRWQTIQLRDGERTFAADRSSLGIQLDAEETARLAFEQGRGEGNPLRALLGGVEIAPVFTVDPGAMSQGLQIVADQVNTQPVDAGVEVVNGQVQERPAVTGRIVDIGGTMAQLADDNRSLVDGEITLVMADVQPTVTDATPILNAAAQVLGQPLTMEVFDPVTGDTIRWEVAPSQWAGWLTASPNPASSIGLTLRLNDDDLRAYLNAQSAVFDRSRYIDIDEAVDDIQAGIATNRTGSTLRVRHRAREYVVQPGDSITSIAWDFGIPYLYIQEANDGINGVSIGQTITIPRADLFLEYDPVPDKRVEVSISEQRVRVYENGQIKWDWIASTGINDSPTWPGLYQIISHVDNAYAGNWNLYMPWFMGVYRPIPGAAFTNGFHGFPTRGGGQILWENSLGRKVTYGCILLSNTNVQLLWDWAETGVVVEILP